MKATVAATTRDFTNPVGMFNEILISDWLSFCDVKETTSRNYKKAIKKFSVFCTESGIVLPTREDVIEFREWLLSKLKATTAQLYLTGVKLFIRWLSSRGVMLNVSDHVKGIRLETEHKKDALTLKDCKRVMSKFNVSTLKGLRDRAIVGLMLTCGLRSIEIVRADIRDIEESYGRKFLLVHGKGRAGKVERVALPAAVENLIEAYLTARGDSSKNEPLFVSTAHRNAGARLQTQTISRMTKAAFRAAGIDSPRITCHSCRHTFATNALLAGIDLAAVSMVLRHRSIATTMIYRHDIDRMNNTAEATVADAIFG